MIEKITQAFKIRALRKKILLTLGLLVIFRAVAAIPIPGIDQGALEDFFARNEFFGLIDVFSGGGLSSFSLAMLGVAPYITASIIFQLLVTVIPKLKQYQRDGGAEGRRKINQYTRLATVPLALLQTYGTIIILNQGPSPVIPDLSTFTLISILIAATAGSLFLMWLGETITDVGIGNGISMIIFAGILAQLPVTFTQGLITFDSSQIGQYAVFGAIGLAVIASVVFITEGQRKIPISYARKVVGSRQFGGSTSHLPLRVNQAGVIPIIFALSIMVMPGVLANFFVNAESAVIANIAQKTIEFFNDQVYYAAVYFVMVMIFTYFYTSVTFNPDDVAENIQKSGGFIPGIRPGTPTANYLAFVSNRITLAGALFLATIAVMPIIAQTSYGYSTLAIGGTSLLIVVSVALETVKQIESQIVMHDYESI
ncbi:preprotein translocase subunit SecY [Patescibacteria group bacterium]